MSFADPSRIIEQLTLSPGMVVADFGAGAGYLAVRAADVVGETGKVYLVEIQQELLTKATHLAQAHHLNTLIFVHADLESEQGSTLPDGVVDLVLISNILFQVAHPEKVLKEAYRVLRKGGRVLVVDWRASYSGMGPEQQHLFGEDEARRIAAELGFSFMSEIDSGSYHYGLIFKK